METEQKNSEDISERLFKVKRGYEEKRKILARKVLQKELKECTFSPATNKRQTKNSSERSIPFDQRLYADALTRQKNQDQNERRSINTKRETKNDRNNEQASVYERLFEQADQRRKKKAAVAIKHKRYLEEKELEELKQYKIAVKRRQKKVGLRVRTSEKNRAPLFEASYHKKRNIQLKQQKKAREEKGCTFSPKISQRSALLAENHERLKTPVHQRLSLKGTRPNVSAKNKYSSSDKRSPRCKNQNQIEAEEVSSVIEETKSLESPLYLQSEVMMSKTNQEQSAIQIDLDLSNILDSEDCRKDDSPCFETQTEDAGHEFETQSTNPQMSKEDMLNQETTDLSEVNRSVEAGEPQSEEQNQNLKELLPPCEDKNISQDEDNGVLVVEIGLEGKTSANSLESDDLEPNEVSPYSDIVETKNTIFNKVYQLTSQEGVPSDTFEKEVTASPKMLCTDVSSDSQNIESSVAVEAEVISKIEDGISKDYSNFEANCPSFENEETSQNSGDVEANFVDEKTKPIGHIPDEQEEPNETRQNSGDIKDTLLDEEIKSLKPSRHIPGEQEELHSENNLEVDSIKTDTNSVNDRDSASLGSPGELSWGTSPVSEGKTVLNSVSLLKHGRRGRPHPTKFSVDEKAIYWTSKKGRTRFILLSNVDKIESVSTTTRRLSTSISEVITRRQSITTLLKRRLSADQSPEPIFKFKITISPRGMLVLSTKTVEERNSIVNDLRLLLKSVQKSSAVETVHESDQETEGEKVIATESSLGIEETNDVFTNEDLHEENHSSFEENEGKSKALVEELEDVNNVITNEDFSEADESENFKYNEPKALTPDRITAHSPPSMNINQMSSQDEVCFGEEEPDLNACDGSEDDRSNQRECPIDRITVSKQNSFHTAGECDSPIDELFGDENSTDDNESVELVNEKHSDMSSSINGRIQELLLRSRSNYEQEHDTSLDFSCLSLSDDDDEYLSSDDNSIGFDDLGLDI